MNERDDLDFEGAPSEVKPTVVWKVRDPKTGLFYLKQSYGWHVNSKTGTVFNRRASLTVSLTSGNLQDALRRHPDLEVVEFVTVEKSKTSLKDWKKV